MEIPGALGNSSARDQRNFALLMEAVQDLFELRGLRDLMCKAVDRAVLLTEAECGVLFLDDGEGPLPHVARGRDGAELPLNTQHSRRVVGDVWQAGKPSRIARVRTKVDPEDSLDRMKLLSVMAVPLHVKDGRIGVLYVHSGQTTKSFTDDDFELFKVLGGVIATAVWNARLRDGVEAKERLQRHLAFARDVQRGLLPGEPVPPAGYDLAGEGRPCDEISGDYYDVIPTSNGDVALVVGDVSGHGIGSALHMASTRALIRRLIEEGIALEKILAILNRALLRDMASSTFMTLFLGMLEPESRRLTYASAGHNPPLLVRASGSIEQLPRTGPLLAIFDTAEYGTSEPIQLETGDALALYTDGIYEAMGVAEEIYGEERFQASVARHVKTGESADDVVRGVLEDLSAFCAGNPLADDVTCLILRVL